MAWVTTEAAAVYLTYERIAILAAAIDMIKSPIKCGSGPSTAALQDQNIKIFAAYDPVLTRFRAALDDIYRDRLDRVVLFGSPARTEGRSDSDYDVAVCLHTMPDRCAELARLADLRLDFLDETGAFFDAKPYLAGALIPSLFSQNPKARKRLGGMCHSPQTPRRDLGSIKTSF